MPQNLSITENHQHVSTLSRHQVGVESGLACTLGDVRQCEFVWCLQTNNPPCNVKRDDCGGFLSLLQGEKIEKPSKAYFLTRTKRLEESFLELKSPFQWLPDLHGRPQWGSHWKRFSRRQSYGLGAISWIMYILDCKNFKIQALNKLVLIGENLLILSERESLPAFL